MTRAAPTGSATRRPAARPDPPVTTVGLITADRPAALGRALESFVHHSDVHGHRPRFLIVDGSRQPAARAETRAIATTIGRTTTCDVQYVGASEARAFCATVLDGTAPVRPLAPGSAGANRNLLLLMSAGECILSVDDDMVCMTWALPTRRDALVVMGHDEIRQTAFHATRAAALAAIESVPADLLGAHEALLAQSLSDLLTRASEPPDTTRACDHLRSGLAAGRRQVVAVTFSGIAGDSGTYCPGRLLFSSGSVRDCLWSSEVRFTTAMTSREGLRIAETNVVTHTCHCTAGCMGLSNLTVVPPFPAVGRNQDGVFGVLLAVSDPAALFAHVPVGVVHDSHRPSRYRAAGSPDLRAGSTGHAGHLRSAVESRVSELVIALALRLARSVAATAPADRMREVGGALAAVGAMSPRSLVALVTDVTHETRARELDYATAGAGESGCPDYWRAALDEYRTTLEQAMRRPEFFLPIEFRSSSIDAGYRSLAAFMRQFGRQVAAWPTWWAAARAANPRAASPSPAG